MISAVALGVLLGQWRSWYIGMAFSRILLVRWTGLVFSRLSVLPSSFLAGTGFLHTGTFNLDRRPARRTVFQLVQLLAEYLASILTILLSASRLLALYHDTSGEVLELDSTRSLVDLLSTRSCAFEKCLGDFIV